MPSGRVKVEAPGVDGVVVGVVVEGVVGAGGGLVSVGAGVVTVGSPTGVVFA